MTATQHHVAYEYLTDKDIHVFTFLSASTLSIDEFLNQLDAVYSTMTEKDKVRLLIDYRESGIPPMRHMTRRGVEWANQLPIHPAARMAIVTKRDFLVTLFGQLVRTFRFNHLSTRFFEQENNYELALAWLSEDF